MVSVPRQAAREQLQPNELEKQSRYFTLSNLLGHAKDLCDKNEDILFASDYPVELTTSQIYRRDPLYVVSLVYKTPQHLLAINTILTSRDVVQSLDLEISCQGSTLLEAPQLFWML